MFRDRLSEIHMLLIWGPSEHSAWGIESMLRSFTRCLAAITLPCRDRFDQLSTRTHPRALCSVTLPVQPLEHTLCDNTKINEKSYNFFGLSFTIGFQKLNKNNRLKGFQIKLTINIYIYKHIVLARESAIRFNQSKSKHQFDAVKSKAKRE